MRLSIRFLVCFTLTLGASPASAQALFRYERDWTADLGGLMYGFRDVIQTPGEFRRTQVWIGGRLFDPADRLVLAIPPVTVVLAVRYLTRTVVSERRPK